MIYPCQRWIQTAGKPTNIEKSASSIFCDCSIRSDTFTYIISKRSIFRGFESTFLQASLPHLPQNSPGCTWQEAFLQWPQVSGGFWKKTEKSMGFLIKDRDDRWPIGFSLPSTHFQIHQINRPWLMNYSLGGLQNPGPTRLACCRMAPQHKLLAASTASPAGRKATPEKRCCCQCKWPVGYDSG